MDKTKASINYFFVDEGWDPNFYNASGKCIVWSDGCSPILLMWLIETRNPGKLRKDIFRLARSVASDPLYVWVPSFEKKKNDFFFHAKDDIPEIRDRFFRELMKMDFRASVVVARKEEAIFQNRHNAKEEIFYHSLVTHLFKNKLHFTDENQICFAKRGNKNRQDTLGKSISDAIEHYQKKWQNFSSIIHPLSIQTPTGEPCLQAIDYINWAVYRAFVKREDRFINFLLPKIDLVWDIYADKIRYTDWSFRVPYSDNTVWFYTKRNPFALEGVAHLSDTKTP